MLGFFKNWYSFEDQRQVWLDLSAAQLASLIGIAESTLHEVLRWLGVGPVLDASGVKIGEGLGLIGSEVRCERLTVDGKFEFRRVPSARWLTPEGMEAAGMTRRVHGGLFGQSQKHTHGFRERCLMYCREVLHRVFPFLPRGQDDELLPPSPADPRVSHHNRRRLHLAADHDARMRAAQAELAREQSAMASAAQEYLPPPPRIAPRRPSPSKKSCSLPAPLERERSGRASPRTTYPTD